MPVGTTAPALESWIGLGQVNMRTKCHLDIWCLSNVLNNIYISKINSLLHIHRNSGHWGIPCMAMQHLKATFLGEAYVHFEPQKWRNAKPSRLCTKEPQLRSPNRLNINLVQFTHLSKPYLQSSKTGWRLEVGPHNPLYPTPFPSCH